MRPSSNCLTCAKSRSPSNSEELFEGVDPTAVCIDVDVCWGEPVAFVGEGKMGGLLVGLDGFEALPCVTTVVTDAMGSKECFDLAVYTGGPYLIPVGCSYA